MSYLKIRSKWKALPLTQCNKLKANYRRKRADLEAEFQKKCEKLYAMRSEIVNDVSEVDENVVPNIWLNAMKSNKVLRKEITRRDEDPLKYLKNIKCCRIRKGFRLDFHFHVNKYFENSILTKIYHVTDDDKPEDVKATVIHWTEGKNVTEVVMWMKRKRGTNLGVMIGLDRDSFFNFFKSPRDAENENDWDEAGKEFQDKIRQDYRVGTTIRDIIPYVENDMDDTKQPSNLESSTIPGNVVSWFDTDDTKQPSNLGSCSGVPASEGQQGGSDL
ncbi:hypothetical protein MKX03_013866 [Papaver bracteatum]|nr:hypothetical protein MKX03_013866 [Papaver bracteatum]